MRCAEIYPISLAFVHTVGGFCGAAACKNTHLACPKGSSCLACDGVVRTPASDDHQLCFYRFRSHPGAHLTHPPMPIFRQVDHFEHRIQKKLHSTITPTSHRQLTTMAVCDMSEISNIACVTWRSKGTGSRMPRMSLIRAPYQRVRGINGRVRGTINEPTDE